MPGRQELPDTLRRSSRDAQQTWIKAHDSAVETYGEGETAHRVAYAALKRVFEKVGGQWKPKEGRGPSDAQAASPHSNEPGGNRPTAEGVDTNASKRHLYERAQELGVQGRSTMTKDELVDALPRASGTRTGRAR